MDLICQSCGKKGGVADFIDKTCDECGGEIVTREEMKTIERQHKEVMSRGKKNSTWMDLINGEDEF